MRVGEPVHEATVTKPRPLTSLGVDARPFGWTPRAHISTCSLVGPPMVRNEAEVMLVSKCMQMLHFRLHTCHTALEPLGSCSRIPYNLTTHLSHNLQHVRPLCIMPRKAAMLLG